MILLRQLSLLVFNAQVIAIFYLVFAILCSTWQILDWHWAVKIIYGIIIIAHTEWVVILKEVASQIDSKKPSA